MLAFLHFLQHLYIPSSPLLVSVAEWVESFISSLLQKVIFMFRKSREMSCFFPKVLKSFWLSFSCLICKGLTINKGNFWLRGNLLYTVEPWLLNDSQIKQFRVWLKNLSKKCLGDQRNFWSLNTWVKLMTTGCARLTTETFWTQVSLPEQHCFSF